MSKGSTKALIEAVRTECKLMVETGQGHGVTDVDIDRFVSRRKPARWWWRRDQECLFWWINEIRQWKRRTAK